MTIDSAKSPETAKLEKKLSKYYKEQKGLEGLVVQIAIYEENMNAQMARLGVYESLLKQLQSHCGRGVDREMLTPVDLRQKITNMGAVIWAATDTVANIK